MSTLELAPPELLEDGFNLQVTIIANGDDECAESNSCDTSDGCSSTCSSACVSA